MTELGGCEQCSSCSSEMFTKWYFILFQKHNYIMKSSSSTKCCIFYQNNIMSALMLLSGFVCLFLKCFEICEISLYRPYHNTPISYRAQQLIFIWTLWQVSNIKGDQKIQGGSSKAMKAFFELLLVNSFWVLRMLRTLVEKRFPVNVPG